MDAVDAEAEKSGQAAWPFHAGAAAAAGLLVAILVAQVTRVFDMQGTRLPTVALTIAVGTALALAAALGAVAPIGRSGLGSASAGLLTGTAIVAGPFGLLLLPAALLVGAGAAVTLESEERPSVRWLCLGTFVLAIAIGVWRVIP